MTNSRDYDQWAQNGLYCPQMESDACGTGFIAQLDGRAEHDLVENALTMLANMEHRGAVGCEENTGDGAGISLKLPHAFLQRVAAENNIQLPPAGQYAAGMIFFPQDAILRRTCRTLLDDYAAELGFEVLGYRVVPTDNSMLGNSAKASEPQIQQVFLKPHIPLERRALERRLFVLRKFAHHNIYHTMPQVGSDFYIASLSAMTIIYKGQLMATQLRPYFLDLQADDFASTVALVHSRFSTNTVPKWKLAQPFRFIAHNGEINTIQGNISRWEALESLLSSPHFTADEIEKLKPICGEGLSDSGVFDNVLEFLVMSGRSLPHAMMMMIPEAWQHDPHMNAAKKAFYEYHALLMEPWDGPASICFTDGTVVGALLDRNGLRPSRYCLLDDNTLIVASEAGALAVDPARVVAKGRLQPGKMLVADLDEGRLYTDEEVKQRICERFPYDQWIRDHVIHVQDIPYEAGNGGPAPTDLAADAPEEITLLQRQRSFGFTREDIHVLIQAAAELGDEPTGSMGQDTPLAILSDRPQPLANYFKQLFAQVTNPPIDPIRERAVMSLFTPLGGAKNPLDLDLVHPFCIALDSPVLSDHDMARLHCLQHPHLKMGKINTLFIADGQKGRLQAALDLICAEAEHKVRNGDHLLLLSDRDATVALAPIPALLITGAVHQHLSRVGLRSQTALIIESGELRESHHFATLLGYGANAIYPYLIWETIGHLYQNERLNNKEGVLYYRKNYAKAIEKGLLKIMSKMGISTLQSYIGGQLFEAIGLGQAVIKRCFSGTISRLGGLNFDDLATEALLLHREGFGAVATESDLLPHGGMYSWQKDGEVHLLNPTTIHLLQHSVRSGNYLTYKKYAQHIDRQTHPAITLRGLMDFRMGSATPVPLEEVEPVEAILKRFVSGAMSLGSLSHEAHSTLAIAMNRMGAKSNSGEGGEDNARYDPLPNGDSMRSAVKQVASGRFGVTSWYLASADELQIKMAQGAKPGEGGQLPGHKVDEYIAKVRNSTPGVGLISPPPHHDIYSIEDLAQLIFDLKNANPKAKISVKLVSKAGVGIIASGVAKARADVIIVSGHDGGTGASPLGSIRHAGLPWELGLAETHQTLIKNGLRNRVRLQTDGQIRTGRDLAIATLLGAEEWGVATAALVAEGCIMMRKCHLNTCPVGIATQDPELRKKFSGQPEYIVNFFTFLAQDLREIMASLGFRTVQEMVGRVEMLKTTADLPVGKVRKLDLSPLLYQTMGAAEDTLEDTLSSDVLLSVQPAILSSATLIANLLDHRLMHLSNRAVSEAVSYQSVFPITNTDRATGTMLSYEISRRWRDEGLPKGSIQLHFKGSAGQSFGAFGAKGLQLLLEGEANDYIGKGLSGAEIIVIPDRTARFNPAANILVGNVALIGATSGEAYLYGIAGERFAVRNSGALAVVEGVGDHACEYMTGGCVVVLGATGRNFAAGMTGGTAYVFDAGAQMAQQINPDNVELEIPTAQDLETVRFLIRRHLHFTASVTARNMLLNWADQAPHFVKIMPRDYKAALLAQTKIPDAATPKVVVPKAIKKGSQKAAISLN